MDSNKAQENSSGAMELIIVENGKKIKDMEKEYSNLIKVVSKESGKMIK